MSSNSAELTEDENEQLFEFNFADTNAHLVSKEMIHLTYTIKQADKQNSDRNLGKRWTNQHHFRLFFFIFSSRIFPMKGIQRNWLFSSMI